LELGKKYREVLSEAHNLLKARISRLTTWQSYGGLYEYHEPGT
jgi:hypothetical protein